MRFLRLHAGDWSGGGTPVCSGIVAVQKLVPIISFSPVNWCPTCQFQLHPEKRYILIGSAIAIGVFPSTQSNNFHPDYNEAEISPPIQSLRDAFAVRLHYLQVSTLWRCLYVDCLTRNRVRRIKCGEEKVKSTHSLHLTIETDPLNIVLWFRRPWLLSNNNADNYWKPFCKRCTSTGRKCDGYEPPPASNSTPRPKSAPQFSFNPCEDGMEQQFVNYFGTNTASVLSGNFSPNFWEQRVLQAGHVEPSIRHAMIGKASFQLVSFSLCRK